MSHVLSLNPLSLALSKLTWPSYVCAQITLFGQSAGAQSTLIHLTLPSSAPYFRNAILESTPIAIPYKRFPEAILLGSLFAGQSYTAPACGLEVKLDATVFTARHSH